MSSDELVSLVSIWQPRIRAFFTRRCRDHDDVDDLVQEANASIIRCYHTFSQRSTISTWVYAVCRNVLSNYYYYRDRDHRLVHRLSLDPPDMESPLPVALREAIGQLPGDGKRLYALYYVEGLSIRQIATRLGRPEGTVKYLLHILRMQVRRLLDV
jgi:RNA polymerase sigma-70 factor (ECF subfamily)